LMLNVILLNVVAPWNAPLCRQKQRIYFKTNQGDQIGQNFAIWATF
jgi:hypothetical protein